MYLREHVSVRLIVSISVGRVKRLDLESGLISVLGISVRVRLKSSVSMRVGLELGLGLGWGRGRIMIIMS